MEKPATKLYAEAFKALGDETRVRIMQMLNAKPRSVGEIVDFFSLAQPTISRHLAVLRQAGLVTSRRRGPQVIYSVSDEGLRDRALGFLEGFECCRAGGKKASGKSL